MDFLKLIDKFTDFFFNFIDSNLGFYLAIFLSCIVLITMILI